MEDRPEERGNGRSLKMPERKKDTHTCFRHPLKTARRRCFECKRHICPQCQHKAEGHIFCSDNCVREYRREERREKVADFYHKKGKGYIFRLVFYPSMIVLALLSFFLYRQWTTTIEEKQVEAAAPAANKPDKKRFPDWSSPGNIEIALPAENAKVAKSEIKVEGNAPKEAMVGLYVNSERIDAVFSEDGKFLFDRVPLRSSESILQVRFFDNYGNNAYSKAIKVFLDTAPSVIPLPRREEPYFSPVLSTFLDLKQAREGKKRVLLTFDGGSNDNATDNIIKVLRESGVKATIFVTGEYIRKYPEKVKRLLQEGNVIGNHTYSHPHLTTYSFNEKQATLPGVTRDVLKSQLAKAADLYRSVTGQDFAPYWRAPFGEKNSEITRWAYESGYRHMHWTPRLDTLDWVADRTSPLFREPKAMLRNILSQADKGDGFLDGGIVLMHLGSERADELRADSVLADLIASLKARGYTFITVEETEWASQRPPESGEAAQ